MTPRPLTKRYDLAHVTDLDAAVDRLVTMIREARAEQEHKREQLAQEAATAYQVTNEALRLTNDGTTEIVRTFMEHYNALSTRLCWFEDRTTRGRVRRVRRWLAVRWWRLKALLTREIDDD